MLFSSFKYLLLFLPVVALGNAALRKYAGARAAQAWLLLASLFFYAFARPAHLAILVASIVFNWAIVRAPGRKKAWLIFGLGANIALLSSFKYVNFFLGQINSISGTHFAIPNWDFPLGISFFTLIQIMYLVDCYQELNGPISLFDHASVVSFFPYVSSGPIVRAKEIADQFGKTAPDGERLLLACRGLFLFAQGLTKKVVFADTFATMADIGFGAVGKLSSLEAWVFSLAYTLQIYFDFSGYSDMAVGSAWILGYEIPQNFNSPYFSKSISEFWQRWHISLSNFITNYLYTPILRSFRKATLRTSAISTLVAMGIAGLWHGPGWTYIVFGLMHGSALAINQYWKKSKRKLPRGMGWLSTFVFVNIAFVVFRSPNLGAAGQMLARLVPHGNILGRELLSTVASYSPSVAARQLVLGAGLAFLFRSSFQRALAFRPTLRSSIATAALLVVSFFFLNSSVAKQFVYFAF